MCVCVRERARARERERERRELVCVCVLRGHRVVDVAQDRQILVAEIIHDVLAPGILTRPYLIAQALEDLCKTRGRVFGDLERAGAGAVLIHVRPI